MSSDNVARFTRVDGDLPRHQDILVGQRHRAFRRVAATQTLTNFMQPRATRSWVSDRERLVERGWHLPSAARQGASYAMNGHARVVSPVFVADRSGLMWGALVEARSCTGWMSPGAGGASTALVSSSLASSHDLTGVGIDHGAR